MLQENIASNRSVTAGQAPGKIMVDAAGELKLPERSIELFRQVVRAVELFSSGGDTCELSCAQAVGQEIGAGAAEFVLTKGNAAHIEDKEEAMSHSWKLGMAAEWAA